MANSSGSDDMLNRVMPRDNIGLAALLKTNETAWENCKLTTPDVVFLYVSIHISVLFMHMHTHIFTHIHRYIYIHTHTSIEKYACTDFIKYASVYGPCILCVLYVDSFILMKNVLMYDCKRNIHNSRVHFACNEDTRKI